MASQVYASDDEVHAVRQSALNETGNCFPGILSTETAYHMSMALIGACDGMYGLLRIPAGRFGAE